MVRGRLAGLAAAVAALTCCGVMGSAAASAGTDPGLVAAAGQSGGQGTAWGVAERVPGVTSLNGELVTLSCASSGDCIAGGRYITSQGTQGLVASEVNGTWGKAGPMKGLEALNTGDNAWVYSVSCASGGNCTAGGYYGVGTGGVTKIVRAFVADQVDGSWQPAQKISMASVSPGAAAEIWSVSCPSAGNCSAGGKYMDASTQLFQGFVVSQVNGVWGKAQQVPGLASLSQGKPTKVAGVSCASAGNCSAKGYVGELGHRQAFVASETNGKWGTAQLVPAPGTATSTQIESLSCASAGNCSAGGSYIDSTTTRHAFVVSEVNGTWGKVQRVPGLAALDTGSVAAIQSVSCAAAGECAGAGFYRDSAGSLPFVVSEVNGTWLHAQPVPVPASQQGTSYSDLYAVSCPSPGDCAAAGGYGGRRCAASPARWGPRLPSTRRARAGGPGT